MNPNENCSGKQNGDDDANVMANTPSPFAMIFISEYNFFFCWYFHTHHNFNTTNLDILHRRLNDSYNDYQGNNDDNKNLTQQDLNQPMNVENYEDFKVTNIDLEFSPTPEHIKRSRRLEAVKDAFIQVKETSDLIKRHMDWLEEIKIGSVLALPELYCKRPRQTLVSLMIMCSKARLFIRCVLENLRSKDWEKCERKENAKYKHVDEVFVEKYIPYYLKLENSKPRNLKPCTCHHLSLDPPLTS